MIYLSNPRDKGSDIVDIVIGEPGQARKYTLLKGETWGFEDQVAEGIIKIYGVVDGDGRGMSTGFLRIVQPTSAKKIEALEVEKDGKKIFQCTGCEFSHEKKIAVLGHINIKHKDQPFVDGGESQYKVNEGIKIIPPMEIERLRKQRQENASMRPKRSLTDLRPRGEDEMGYTQRPGRVDINDTGLDTKADMARHFYGPGLEEDRP